MTKPPHALPQTGGSFLRAKDGSLKPNPDDQTKPADAPVKPAVSKPAKKEA